MALVLADRVQDTTTTTGTGSITLAGSPPSGFQSFAAVGNGNSTYYTISGGSEWEVGIGTYNSAGPTLNRDTVLSSSNGGALVNFSAGTKIVFVTYPSEKSVNYDVAGNVNINITGNAATATRATNLYDGAAGSIPYQTAANTTAFVAAASGVLVGGTTPSFSTAPTLTGTNFTGIPNAALSNNSVTIGSTSVSLGATATSLAGLTSVTLTQDPTTALQAATKQYVDTLAAEGVSYHAPVKYEAPNPLTATYNNGTAGVGATLTNAGTQTAFTPDGVVAQVGDRILIYQQANAVQNGVYTVTTVGDGSTNWVLTRATDANSYGVKDPNKLGAGDAFFVQSGNTGAGETYVCNTAGTITFGTTAITFVQISDASVYTAGTGLTLTGTEFSLTSPVATTLGGTGLTTFGAANRALYSSGTTTLTAGTLPHEAGGTGFSSYTDGQLLIGKSSDGSLVKANLTAGTAISIVNGAGAITITNTAPDQVVSLTGGGTTTITGSYPNFNITSADQYTGDVVGPASATDNAIVRFDGTTGKLVQTSAVYIDDSGQVGIGAAASTGTTLRIGKNLTGAVNSLGVYNNQAIQSDVTTSAQLFSTFPTTAAAAFTLGSLTHYSASQSTIGASSAITTQVGFSAQATLVGATNNYGFYGNIPSGTGRYNIYMAGTADNYLAGNVGIGNTNPAYPLEVTSISTGANGIAIRGRASDNISTQAFLSNDGATTYGKIQGRSTDLRLEASSSNTMTFYTNVTERMRLDASGNLGINATPAAWGANFKGIEGYGNSTFFLSGNSVNGITTVGNAYQNGTNWVYTTTGAAARYQVGTSAAPHIWSYAASGTGGTALTWTEGMRIDSAGNLLVGTTSALGKLVVSGNSVVLDSGAVGHQVITKAQANLGVVSAYSNQTGGMALSFETTPSGGGATERARIDSAGNLLVGNTNGTSKVTVTGVVESTTGGFKFPDGTTQTTAATAGLTQAKATGLNFIFGL